MKFLLTIDGGGIKGIVSAYFLESLEKRLAFYSGNKNARVSDYFDIIAGTSTGAILTGLLLATNDKGDIKYSATDLVRMYREFGDQIFIRQWFYPFFGTKFKNDHFKEKLNEIFGDQWLSKLPKPCLMIAYDMLTKKAVFFNSLSARKESLKDIMVKDAILASCAAPSILPAVCIKDKQLVCKECLIDGGVVANNPALCGVIETMKLPRCKGIEEVVTVSVGNLSEVSHYKCDKVKRWGIYQWVSNILPVIMDGSEQTVDYQLKRLYQMLNLSENYYRFSYKVSETLPSFYNTSDSTYEMYEKYAKLMIKKESVNIDNLAKRLCRNRAKSVQ